MPGHNQRLDPESLRGAMGEEIFLAVQRQTEAISEIRQEALGVLSSRQLLDLRDARQRSEVELQQGERGLLQKLSDHIEQGERMVAELAEQAKQSRMTRIKFEYP